MTQAIHNDLGLVGNSVNDSLRISRTAENVRRSCANDKEQQIHEIANIYHSALRDKHVSQLSVNDVNRAP
jgi:hypothetical protein